GRSGAVAARSALRERVQAFGESSSAAVVSPAEGIIRLVRLDQEVDVVVVDVGGIVRKRQLGIVALERRPSLFEGREGGAILAIGILGSFLILEEVGKTVFGPPLKGGVALLILLDVSEYALCSCAV